MGSRLVGGCRRFLPAATTTLSSATVSDVRIEDVHLSDDDPRQALIELLGTIAEAFNALPVAISDGRRMADDRAATADLLDLPLLCEHYLSGSEDFLLALHKTNAAAAKYVATTAVFPLPVDPRRDRVQRPNRVGART
jgi:hypothetical protein